MIHNHAVDQSAAAYAAGAIALLMVFVAAPAAASVEFTEPAFELDWLSGSNGFIVSGIGQFGRLGNSADGTGDVNGDGIDDVIIGAEGTAPDGREGAGEAYVIFGRPGDFAAKISAAALTGQNGFRIPGLQPLDSAGSSVAGAGDVNGDGLQDIVVGAPGAEPGGISGAGEAYVIFGNGTGFPASFDLATLNGDNGFKFVGSSFNSSAGFAVSTAGDVNGDGIDDVLLGSPGALGFTGAAYVVFGTRDGFPAALDAAQLNGTNGFAVSGYALTDSVGRSVGRVGDINNDNIDDIIIGSVNRNWVFVVYGSDTGFPANVATSALNGTNGFRIDGGAIDDNFGEGKGVNAAGDINGDGIDDLIIGSPNADVGGVILSGQAHVIFGKAGSSFGAVFNVDSLNGSNGFSVIGRDRINFTGYCVAGAGDTNGDGIDDVLISAHALDPGGRELAGGAFVIFGSTHDFPAQIELAELSPERGFVINGRSPGENTGWSARPAGDVNADGRPDIILGAVNAETEPALEGAGEAYVVFGGSPALPGLFLTADTDADDATAIGLTAGGVLNLQIDAFGFSREESQTVAVTGETGNFNVYLFDDEIGVVFFDIPPNALSLAVSITASDGPDADMFVGFDANGDGMISPDEERCNSGSPGSAEVCEVALPEAGSWWVAVMNWSASSPGATHTHTVTTLALRQSGSDLEVTGPAGPVPAGVPFDLDLAWNTGPAVPGDRFAGAIVLGSDVGSEGDLGIIPVELLRIDTDTDADGIVDSADNCTEVANADQRDTNGDGFGNLCDADLNNDGIVNSVDLGLFKAVFFTSDPDADFNGDGSVNPIDLGIIKASFFLPPGPSALAP